MEYVIAISLVIILSTLYLQYKLNGQYIDNSNTIRYYRYGKLHRKDGPAVEYSNGDREWWIEGKLHREGGPAIEYSNGDRVWFINGKIHREDGPAIEYYDGTKEWWIEGKEYSEKEYNKKVSEINFNKDGNPEIDEDGTKQWRNEKGKLHRDNGPAYEEINGYKSWWINGKLHRLDGPAVEYADGNKYWYIEGKNYSEEEFNKKISDSNNNNTITKD